MGVNKKLGVLSFISLIIVALFLLFGLNANTFEYAISKRIPKIFAIILTGGAIAVSSIIFQTISSNRILTPSILGLDSLYMLVQTFLVFMFGANNITVLNNNINFILSTLVMVGFSILLFKLLFLKEKSNIFLLLLVGIIFGTLFQSLSSFMQMTIEPKAFMAVQDKMFASFNNVNTGILTISIIIVGLVLCYVYKYINILDVMVLGREQAINLGVNYDSIVKKMLIVIGILVSISTALVGPMTFLGLIVANLTYEVMNNYKHKYLIAGGALISIIALVGGQFIIERMLNFKTTLSVIINLVGGVYFIYLLLKENKSL
ncbi:iron chelate uptake ABC transporter family permease subunit [Clostridium tagluense]|uniref:Iron ABC transporter permease n=1 Tax=Clostridium tagluense TaxID=360422 RepID=A0A401UFZ0_9CLOT|nr:iron chelate uptake ABC transporter family permease subunit [Clostridium tagluense]GCD08448.1 iron ABC transporter permease [Clostridium tagluense]